jgi:hypothetical protein
MPPIDAPTTACRMFSPISSRSRPNCDSTMSRNEKRGNCMPGWLALLLGELLSPFPIGSTHTTK